MNSSELMDIRTVIAEKRWQAFNFNIPVEDSDGWKSDTGSDEVSRTVYYQNSNGPTTKGHFTVCFQPGGIQIVEEYAMCGGNFVGNSNSPVNMYNTTVYVVFKARIENISANTPKQAAVIAEEFLLESGALDKAEITLKASGDKQAGTYVSSIDFAEESLSVLVDVHDDVDYRETIHLKLTGDDPVPMDQSH